MRASVLLVDPKFDFNVGGALRACAIFGAHSLLWTGTRVQEPDLGRRLPREERLSAYSHMPRMRVKETTAMAHLGKAWTPVIVEVRDNAEALDGFDHPDEAIYVFGPEDGTLGRKWLSLGHRFVVIPTVLRSPLNLAAAVNVVLYDRYAKERKAPDMSGAVEQYDPVGSGYALDDPKHPDTPRWT